MHPGKGTHWCAILSRYYVSSLACSSQVVSRMRRLKCPKRSSGSLRYTTKSLWCVFTLLICFKRFFPWWRFKFFNQRLSKSRPYFHSFTFFCLLVSNSTFMSCSLQVPSSHVHWLWLLFPSKIVVNMNFLFELSSYDRMNQILRI